MAALSLQHFLLPTTLLESKKLTLLEVYMTTVAQMIEWMKTLPQDAEVECGVEVRCSYESYMEMRSVNIESCDVFDYTGPEYEKYPHIFGKTIVNICGD
jgi:hypothetical protein